MKNILIATAALIGLASLPQPARAGGQEGWAAVGGFIGGVIVGANIDRHDSYRSEPACPPPRCDTPRGYWREVPVRIWVPARTVYFTDHCGRRIARCEPGYYTCRTDRVWVSTERSYGRDHGHSHRSVIIASSGRDRH